MAKQSFETQAFIDDDVKELAIEISNDLVASSVFLPEPHEVVKVLVKSRHGVRIAALSLFVAADCKWHVTQTNPRRR